MTAQLQIRLDVWSDYVCPFCYLELPVIERLRPEPVPTLDPGGEYLRSAWTRVVYPMADQRGMALKLPPLQPRSRKALEAAAHARDEGRFDAMHIGIFRAFFEHGLDIGDTDVLTDISPSVGLDAAALQAALEEGRHREAVLEDKHLAQELHITAVPAGRWRRAGADWRSALPLSGALPYEQVRDAALDLLRRAQCSVKLRDYGSSLFSKISCVSHKE